MLHPLGQNLIATHLVAPGLCRYRCNEGFSRQGVRRARKRAGSPPQPGGGDRGDEDRLYTVEEVFPDLKPGDILRGARHREGLTQAQLAAMIGVKPSHISEMEKGKRPIGKDMSKRLAKVLNTSYQIFL